MVTIHKIPSHKIGIKRIKRTIHALKGFKPNWFLGFYNYMTRQMRNYFQTKKKSKFCMLSLAEKLNWIKFGSILGKLTGM